MMAVTQDWEMEFGGLLMGGDGPYSIAEIDGLAGQPDLRTADRTRLRRHGMLAGDDFLGGRAVTISLEVSGADDTTFATNLAALRQALAPGSPEAPLTLKVPAVAGGGLRRLNARPRKLALPVAERYFYRMPVAAVEFFSTDPRIYDDTLSSLVTSLPTAGGGNTFNDTFNSVFGAVSTGGSIFAANLGTFPTPPTFRIDGPCTNPSIENVATGERLEFTITLGSGEWLDIDTDARTVLLGGTASRYSTLTRADWFDLAPGTTELKFRAVTGTSAQLTATWRSAWL